jgi:predicted transcriptional regulator
LVPKEYFKRYGLDAKKYPLVCKEYSEQRRKLAVEIGLGASRRKAAKTA